MFAELGVHLGGYLGRIKNRTHLYLMELESISPLPHGFLADMLYVLD